MSDTTQTIFQSWLRRLFAREMDAEEKQVNVHELNKLFSQIAQAYFEQFTDALVKQPEFTYNEEAKIRSRQIVLDNTLEALNRSIVSYLSKSSSHDAAQAVVDYYIKMNIQRYPLFSSFSKVIDQLKVAFPQNKDAVLKMVKVPSVRIVVHVPTEVSYLIKIIAYILQSIAITAPTLYYSSTQVNVDAKESLIVTLKAIDSIRLKYALGGVDIPLQGLDYALLDLNRKLALAEHRVWLPFKPLVMAPLASREDLKLYARASKDVEIFANRIGRSDGVFLITGYRGVGKSTFIYEALSLLAQKQKYKSDDDFWHIVPISISLAKASGITNILRLCIRRLSDTFLKETDEHSDVMSLLTKGVEKLLTQKEKDHLRLAHLRATWKVNMQRDDNVKALKQLGLDADMSIKLSSFFTPTFGNAVAGTFPSFGINGKMSREWSKAMGSTVALPDYDEDKAEDDIVQFIRMLATPDKVRGNSRIRLVFIFDEMDKMSEEEQEELIKQLKNLFLERHSVFLLVTSKGFYYRWWDKRNVEDDVLTSYFSWIQTVPLFTSIETGLLLRRLIQANDASTQFSKEEGEFIDTLAGYLTYRARGIPRDMMRELQSVQLWIENRPQAYVENRMGQYPVIHVYAELQNCLERLFDYTNISNSTQAPGASTSDSPFSSIVDNTLITEHMWTNEGRKEQVKRGLYVIMEELLDQGSIVLDPDSEVVKRIHEDNFKMVVLHDFVLLLERLLFRLRDIRLKIGPDTPLAFHYPEYTASTELYLFSLEVPTVIPGETTATGFQKVVVLPQFYNITGRSLNVASVEVPIKDSVLTQEQIEALLKSTDNWQLQRAINALQQAKRPFSEGVYDQLCRLFLTSQNIQMRRSVIGLQDDAFFDAVHRVGDEVLNIFIDTETDERLLQEFIRLVNVCTEVDRGTNFTDGTNMLLRVLERHTKARNEFSAQPSWIQPLLTPSSLELSALNFNDTIIILAAIASSDILLQVMQSLNPSEDIPVSLLVDLKKLESNSQQRVIELLVLLDFHAISLATLQTLLETKDDKELSYFWDRILPQKQKVVAQQVLTCLILKLTQYSTEDIIRFSTMNGFTNQVVEWINGSIWDDIDQRILRAVYSSNPSLVYQLQKAVATDKINRLSSVFRVPKSESTTTIPESRSDDSSDLILGIVIIIVLLAIPIAAIIIGIMFHLSFLLWISIGMVTGFIASLVMRGGGYGVVGDIVVGLVGALIGGFLTNLFFTNIWVTSITAFIGACILISILRAVSRSPRRV